MRENKTTTDDYQNGYKIGYRAALLHVAEKLNNANANGYDVSYHHELMDQLAELGSDMGVVTHDDLVNSGV